MPSFAVLVVGAMWVLLFLDPHRFLAAVGPDVLAKTQAVVVAVLITLVVLRFGDILSSAKPWTMCWPLLVFSLAGMAAMAGAIHIGFAKAFAQALLVYWVFVVASVAFVRKPQEIVLLLWLFVIQFAWYGLHARFSGLVGWHSFLGNYDDFGALMAMGVGICFYMGLASNSKRLRWLCFALSAYCMMAVVTTNARGAFLSAVLLGAILWYRSPRKGVATAAVMAGGVIVLLVGSTMYSGGEYWERIMSAFEEGTEQGTGAHRWHLWNAAFRVFLDSPLLGAGGHNFGLYVVDNFGFESVYGYESAAKLWNRSIHNIYMQVLSETGLLGTVSFGWLVASFWKWNRALRKPAFVRAWNAATEGRLDLRNVSLALEMGMIGFLAAGFFYAPLLYHWLYTITAANLMLYTTTRRLLARSATSGRRPVRPPAPSRAQRPILPVPQAGVS